MAENEKRRRGSAVVLLIPLMIGFAVSTRAGHDMRTVDFLRVFGGGACVGASLTALMAFMRQRRSSTP